MYMNNLTKIKIYCIQQIYISFLLDYVKVNIDHGETHTSSHHTKSVVFNTHVKAGIMKHFTVIIVPHQIFDYQTLIITRI